MFDDKKEKSNNKSETKWQRKLVISEKNFVFPTFSILHIVQSKKPIFFLGQNEKIKVIKLSQNKNFGGKNFFFQRLF